MQIFDIDLKLVTLIYCNNLIKNVSNFPVKVVGKGGNVNTSFSWLYIGEIHSVIAMYWISGFAQILMPKLNISNGIL
jgi:hypothetical protein